MEFEQFYSPLRYNIYNLYELQRDVSSYSLYDDLQYSFENRFPMKYIESSLRKIEVMPKKLYCDSRLQKITILLILTDSSLLLTLSFKNRRKKYFYNCEFHCDCHHKPWWYECHKRGQHSWILQCSSKSEKMKKNSFE